MKLLTKAIEKKIPPLYTYENTPASEIPIAVKFFHPISRWTWLATEGERQAFKGVPGGDFIFFGYVFSGIDPDFDELGYFSLSDLESVRGPVRIERDMYFGRHMLSEAIGRKTPL